MKLLLYIMVFAMFIGCSNKEIVRQTLNSDVKMEVNNGLGYAIEGDFTYTIRKKNFNVKEDGKEIFNRNFDAEISSYVIDSSSDVVVLFNTGLICEFNPHKRSFTQIDELFEPLRFIRLSSDNKFIIGVSEHNKIVIIDRLKKNISMGSYEDNIVDVKFSNDSKIVYIQFYSRIVAIDFIEKKEIEIITF